MNFFENLLLLMLVAILLLQVARRFSLPYPALLAAAGVGVGMIPALPDVPIEPHTYLPLFLAPVLVDAAYDFPPGATRRFLAPLFTFAVIAVLATALVVGWLGQTMLGLSFASALALGAVVAPPDAAAASAVLRGISIPRNTFAVLQGESLFNDSTSLLLFTVAVALLSHQGVTSGIALRIGVAAPGGVLLGIALAYGFRRINHYVKGTLGGNVLQFVAAYSVWMIAERLQLSAVLCTVAFAMMLAHWTDQINDDVRMRVQTYAVWSAVVFTLNVFAFLLMGMQAHVIIARMNTSQLLGALKFAGIVILVVLGVRMLIVVAFHTVDDWWERFHGRPQASSWRQSLFVGWCGMRGFVTMAAALSLPGRISHRDEIVLTAFCVVLATLVLQGLTIRPLVRLLKLDRTAEASKQLSIVREAMAEAGLNSIEAEQGREAEHLRTRLALTKQACGQPRSSQGLRQLRKLGLRAVKAEREKLEELRHQNEIGVVEYLELQEEIDWVELTHLPDRDRRIEEI